MSASRKHGGATVAPLTLRILSDERLYGDGSPHWRGQQTTAEAESTARRIRKMLLKLGREYPVMAAFANDTVCEAEARCASPACASCARAFQRWYVAQQVELWSGPGSGRTRRKLMMVSVVSVKCRLPFGASRGELLGASRTFRRMARELGAHWICGAVEVKPYEGSPPYLDVHAHFHTESWRNPRELEVLLRDWLRRDGGERGKRPAEVIASDGQPYVFSYPMKYWIDRKLPPEVRAQVLLAHHRLGFDGRLLMTGVRRYKQGDTVVLRRCM